MIILRTGRLRRFLAAATLAASLGGAAVALTACDPQPAVVATPVAYGEVINGQGRCYYDDDLMGEAYLLISAGRCPSTWVPYPMPDYWRARYVSYYSSDAWLYTYVPVAQRTYYRTYSVRYSQTHVTIINQQSRLATYRVGTKTVTGTKGLSFGSGAYRSTGSSSTTRRDTTYGGGSARTGSSTYGGGSARRPSGGTYGGGSARSGRRP